MEQSRNDQFQCTPMQYGFGELQPASSIENPESIVNMQSDGRTMDLRMSEVKPVLNYSIQTGEEFAFEFMRDRANSRKLLVSDSVSDPNCASGYMDLKGILGLSRTGSECGSDISMITSMEKGSKDLERKNSSLHGDRNNHGSAHHKSREPSKYDSGRAIGHGYASSGTSDGSSAKMKVLCSFGGKILPRPSDSKLRYVGGETRIIQIKKDISWQELMQKTSSIYSETYAIKYQLPGEDLDALVSVSCDEDLQNMMEECNEFKDEKGSKKLRIFLFSMSDLDEGHFSMGNVDNDSEIQYVVAVNGMDSTRKSSNLHGLSNFSANNLDETDGQSIERGTVLRDLVGVNASALTGNIASSSLQSSQPVRASASNAYETFVQTYHEPQGQYPEIPSTQLKGKLNDSFEKEICRESGCSSNPSHLFDGNSMTHNTSDKKSTPVSIAQGEFPFLAPKNETVLHCSEGLSSMPASGNPIVSRSSDMNNMPSNAYTHGYMDSESKIVDLSPVEPPAVVQRVYYSERIPRGQEELLNRLSKSDDSHGSQFLISHSQSDQDQIPDSIVKLQDSSNYESENSIPMEKPSHTATKVRNDGLSQCQDGRNINEAVSGRNWNISHDGDAELKFQNNFGVKHDSKVDGIVKADKEPNCPVNNNEKLAGFILSRPESGLPALGQVSSVKNHGDSALDLLQLNLGKAVGMRCTDDNSLEQSQLASKEENLIYNVTENPSTGDVTKPAQGDIVIDIDDRFSRDFLSDIFSKAIPSEDSLDISGQLHNDGTGLSLDVENHEHKGWAYLAQEKFVQNDVSLIDQDHIGFPSAPKTVGDDFAPLTTITREDSQLNFGDDQKVLHRISGNDATNFLSRNDHSQLNGIDSSQFDAMMENLKTLEYRHEDVKVESKDSGLPPHDPSLGNFDPTTLQIIMNDDLEELKELGSGTFGTVYHGKWRGTDVAIKRIKKTCFMGRSSELERLTVEFWREADILSKLHHPNVVAFYGVVQDGPGGTLATVTEYMVDGSLRHVLLSKDKHLDRRKRLIIARQSPVPLSVSTPQQPAAINLNSKAYTDKVSLFLFALHLVLAVGLVCFLVFKGIQGLFYASESIKRKEKRVLQYFLPQVEVASLLSISLAFAWQKAVRLWPKFMVHFILWGSFALSLSAGILLVCFQMPATEGVGVCFLVFAIGNGLYACWVSQRIGFCSKVFVKSLEPVCKFPDLNQPTYWMLGAGFLWMSFWILAIIGALNFYFPPLTIIVLVLSLLWTAEVMRNVANITVSRVISLYYLRGMQCNTQFCLQRALTRNLGSASLGSLFVPTIEALRILARGLNLLEGEDEFMFSCAHCCLHVMNSIFRRGNSWAFVQIASYGKDFVRASQDTWKLFEMTDMVQIVDSDITSSICFLTGVCSGSICVIVIASWTFTVHRGFTATISLLSFIVGYLMTRIAMALPHACVSCYYVCYAENPDGRLFDDTIKDRQALLKSNRDVIMTPRMPRRSRT